MLTFIGSSNSDEDVLLQGFPGGVNGKESACHCRRCETRVRSLGREDPLEESTATHSSILAWRIPWTEDPGRLQSMGSHIVGHNWSDLSRMPTERGKPGVQTRILCPKTKYSTTLHTHFPLEPWALATPMITVPHTFTRPFLHVFSKVFLLPKSSLYLVPHKLLLKLQGPAQVLLLSIFFLPLLSRTGSPSSMPLQNFGNLSVQATVT